jgi:hypothetical protein
MGAFRGFCVILYRIVMQVNCEQWTAIGAFLAGAEGLNPYSEPLVAVLPWDVDLISV